ncbi:MAG TPA: hypothetical protein VKH46_07540 [Thermoanaerobaculia bacterium]|nr:hypothetical protein [Thermoanaerobaculia bacterium]
MRIGGVSLARNGDRVALSARVEWEESGRPPFELTFTSRGTGADVLGADPHPFLLASVVPAWRSGERRIAVEGAVCPRLRDGIAAVQRLLSAWWKRDRPPAALEPSDGFRPFAGRRERSALFLTGGVDSLHLLRKNRQAFPAGHPASFRDAISIRSMSFAEEVPTPRAGDLARRHAKAVAEIAARNDLEVVEIDGNFRILGGVVLAGPQDQGALLASAAHAFAQRIGSASIAATLDAGALHRWGTHPLLDPLFSSSGVEIRHEEFRPGRSEKIAEIAGWDVARRHLQVCFEGPLPDGESNCGRCEKCLRTMTALAALGVLDDFAAFGGRRVTPEAIESMTFGYSPENFALYWAPLVPLLERGGAGRIAAAVRAKIAEARRIERWHRDAGWKGKLRRLDRGLLGGTLQRVTQRWRGTPPAAPG